MQSAVIKIVSTDLNTPPWNGSEWDGSRRERLSPMVTTNWYTICTPQPANNGRDQAGKKNDEVTPSITHGKWSDKTKHQVWLEEADVKERRGAGIREIRKS